MPKLSQLEGELSTLQTSVGTVYSGLGRQEAAKLYKKRTGDNYFRPMEGGGLAHFIAKTGSYFDEFGDGTGINKAVGDSFANTVDYFGGSQATIDASRAAGQEMFGGVASMAMLAIPGIGLPLSLAFGYADAQGDALESGKSWGESYVSGSIGAAVNVVSGGAGNLSARALGKLINPMRVTALPAKAGHGAIRTALFGTAELSAKSTSKVVQALRSTAHAGAHGFGQTAAGVSGDVMDMVLTEPGTSIWDKLSSPEYYIPMLMGDSVTYAGTGFAVRQVKNGLAKDKGRRLDLKQEQMNGESDTAYRYRQATDLDITYREGLSIREVIAGPDAKNDYHSPNVKKYWEVERKRIDNTLSEDQVKRKIIMKSIQNKLVKKAPLDIREKGYVDEFKAVRDRVNESLGNDGDFSMDTNMRQALDEFDTTYDGPKLATPTPELPPMPVEAVRVERDVQKKLDEFIGNEDDPSPVDQVSPTEVVDRLGRKAEAELTDDVQGEKARVNEKIIQKVEEGVDKDVAVVDAMEELTSEMLVKTRDPQQRMDDHIAGLEDLGAAAMDNKDGTYDIIESTRVSTYSLDDNGDPVLTSFRAIPTDPIEFRGLISDDVKQTVVDVLDGLGISSTGLRISKGGPAGEGGFTPQVDGTIHLEYNGSEELLFHELGHFVHTKLAGTPEGRVAMGTLMGGFKRGLAKLNVEKMNEVEFFQRFGTLEQLSKADKDAFMSEDLGYVKYRTETVEWFADQFNHWANTSNKPKTVVEKFMSKFAKFWKDMYQKLSPGTFQDKNFKAFMNKQAEQFFSNLVRRNKPEMFDALQKSYDFPPREQELMSSHIYKYGDDAYMQRLIPTLQDWDAKGRVRKLSSILGDLKRDVGKKPIVKVKGEITMAETEVHKIIQRLEDQGGKNYIKVSRVVSDIMSRKVGDAVDPDSVIRSTERVVARWATGRLNGQTKPMDGGRDRLLKAVNGVSVSNKNGNIERVSLKLNGKMNDTKKEKLMRYDTYEDALSVSLRMDGEINQGDWSHTVESKTDKDGEFFFIVGKRDKEFAMGDIDQYGSKRDDDFFKFDDTDSFVQEQHGSMGYDQDESFTLLEHRALPSRSPGQVTRDWITSGSLPKRFKKALDRSAIEFDQQGGQAYLDGLARDIGLVEGSTLDQTTTALVRMAESDPVKAAEMLLYLPASYNKVIKGIIKYNADAYETIKLTAQHKKVIGVDPLTGEAPKKGDPFNKDTLKVQANLNNARKEVGTDLALERAVTALQPGTLSERGKVNGMFGAADKTFDWVQRAFNEISGDAIHIGMADKRVSLGSEAIHAETINQTRYIKEAIREIHMEDPQNGKFEMKKDRSFNRVTGDERLLQVYNDIKRLEQTEDTSFLELQTAGRLEEMFHKLAPEDVGAIADLLERSHKAQMAHTENRISHLNEMDQLTASKQLVRETGMPPRQARDIIKALDGLEGQQRIDLMVQSGIDPQIADKVMQFRDGMAQSTTDVAKFLRKRPHYVTERRMNQFLVRYVYTEGSRLGKKSKSGAQSFETAAEAQAFIQAAGTHKIELIDKKPKDTWINTGGKFAQKQDIGDMFQAAMEKKQALIKSTMGGDLDAIKVITDALDSIQNEVNLVGRANNVNALDVRRRFKHGREELDMLTQQREYFERSALSMSRSATDANFDLMKTDPALTDESGQQSVKLLDQSRTNLRTQDTRVGKLITKFNFLMFLGTNMSSAIIEGTTFSMNLTPLMVEHGAGIREAVNIQRKIAGPTAFNVGRQILSLGKRDPSADWKNPEHSWIIRRAELDNKLGLRRYEDIDMDVIDNEQNLTHLGYGTKKPLPQVAGGLMNKAFELSTKMYGWSNRFNAEVSLLSMYELIKKRHPKLTREEQYNKAILLSDVSNANLGKAGRPANLFSGQGLMKTGAMAGYSLLSFANGYIANMIRMSKNSIDAQGTLTTKERHSAQKAMGLQLGIILGTTGVLGMPFAGSLAHLFKTAFGVDLEEGMKEMLLGDDPDNNRFLTDLAMNGIGYAADLPIDVGGRLSVGGIGGFNSYDGYNAMNLLGPAAGYAKSIHNAMGLRAEGTEGWYGDLLPVGTRRAFRLFRDEGSIKSADGTMIIANPSTMQQVGSVLGFGTTEARKKYEKASAQREVADSKRTERTRLINQASYRYQAGDFAAAREILQNEADGNAQLYQSLTDSVSERVLKQTVGYAPNQGVGPEYQRIESLYGGQTESLADRYVQGKQIQRGLGGSGKINQQALYRRSLADGLVTQGVSPGNALLQRNAPRDSLYGL